MKEAKEKRLYSVGFSYMTMRKDKTMMTVKEKKNQAIL
jgi:hypothetical protein